MENNSWIKLYRKIQYNPIFKKGNHFKVWLHILLNVNHKDNYFIFNNKKTLVKKGSGIFSQRKIAEELKISIGNVNQIIFYLKSEHMIETKTTTKYTEVSVLNWSEYQGGERKSEHKVNTKRTQNETNNNVENVENEDIYIQQKPVVDKKELLKKLGMDNALKGAFNEWQDYAIRLWGKLGLEKNPSPSWFKLFKEAFESGKKGLLDSAFSFTQDANARSPERLFYWKFNKLLKGEE